MESLRRVDIEGVIMRSLKLKTINRREYKVYGPNELWHTDTNHKLIRRASACEIRGDYVTFRVDAWIKAKCTYNFRWRLVIHCKIDGFSRAITYLNTKIYICLLIHKKVLIEVVTLQVEAFTTSKLRGCGEMYTMQLHSNITGCSGTWKKLTYLMLQMKFISSVFCLLS